MERCTFVAHSPEEALELAQIAVTVLETPQPPRMVLGSEPTEGEPPYYVVTVGSVEEKSMQRPVKRARMDFCIKGKHASCVGARLGLDIDIICSCRCHKRTK